MGMVLKPIADGQLISPELEAGAADLVFRNLRTFSAAIFLREAAGPGGAVSIEATTNRNYLEWRGHHSYGSQRLSKEQ